MKDVCFPHCPSPAQKALDLVHVTQLAAWCLALPIWVLAVYKAFHVLVEPLLRRDYVLAYILCSLVTAPVAVVGVLLILYRVWVACSILRDPYRERIARVCASWTRTKRGAYALANDKNDDHFFLRIVAWGYYYGREETFSVGCCPSCRQPLICGFRHHVFKDHCDIRQLKRQLDEMLEQLDLDYPSGTGC